MRVAESNEAACDPWDNQAAEALVSLETIAPLRYRSRFGDGNLNGRSYGGQILGQAMMAATLSAPEDRPAAMLQLLFLRGADPGRRITFDPEVLQVGKHSPPAMSSAARTADEPCSARRPRSARHSRARGTQYRLRRRRIPKACPI
ncbi:MULTISPECIES: hypothetical protein [unclassified Bradyrhizobium]|uniref:hypothetical protein n=1 Tax=unclassified Bradyrhizobium TaxID=2631580 RepID=UPI00247AF555|nr:MULTISPECIES: hypothetical protein [unclassified Bradyrhizobium]WGS18765.1 hypothetical protein MTX22_30115 [Bradyrhizobium sp. ISRA463]WGS25589.1 hypothetical protein MTX19_27690 [Bradyrhizobium sp. ISRA464]